MTYKMLRNALNVSELRQRVISSNISNINTPGYKANRLDFEKYFDQALNQTNTLLQTHEQHIASHDEASYIVQQDGTSIQDNGNNVDIDYEMAELAANNIYYDALVSQINAKYKMVRESIK